MAKKRKGDDVPPPENNTSRHLPAKIVPPVKKLKGRKNPLQGAMEADETQWTDYPGGGNGYSAEHNLVKEEERNLKCELTQDELSQGGGKLAGINNKLATIESEKNR